MLNVSYFPLFNEVAEDRNTEEPKEENRHDPEAKPLTAQLDVFLLWEGIGRTLRVCDKLSVFDPLSVHLVEHLELCLVAYLRDTQPHLDDLALIALA